jgi:hypothetical protein
MSTSKLWKPLPDQPTTAPANLNRPLSERNAQKRANRHAKNEAARRPEEQLLNRTDLDVRGKKLYTLVWLKALDSIMRRWCEFMTEKLDSPLGPQYFKEGGLLPDRLLLHQFLFWLADSAEGKVYLASHTPSEATANTNITVSTAERYAQTLFSALTYYNKALDHDLRSSVILWVRNNLSRELNLNRDKYSKTIVYHQDAEYLISAIWDFKALASIHSIRAMFNVTLLINLLIDGASRIGEFLPKDVAATDGQKFIQWQHLEFFALPGNEADSITIFIIITAKWLKNHSHDNYGFKKFVVYLLSPNFAFQDTCRMLVILALQKGLFQHFRTWEDLMSCTPSPHGSPIALKESCLNNPVFTSSEFAEIDGVDVEQPWLYGTLYQITPHLSRLACFRDRFSLTSLRRGDAYVLEKHCKNRSMARTLMGQQTESRAFSTYLSKTSVTHVQALARELEVGKNLTLASAVSLGRCTDAPLTLDKESIEAINSNPEYRQAEEAFDTARQECIRGFGTVLAARQAKDTSPLYGNFVRARNGRYALWNRLAELKFRLFREKVIKERSVAMPMLDKRDVSIENASPPSLPSLPEAGSESIDAVDSEEKDDDEADESSESFIGLRVEDVGHLTSEQTARLVSAMPQEMIVEAYSSKNYDRNAEVLMEAIGSVSNEQYRKHRIIRLELNSLVGQIGRSQTHMSSFSPHYIHLKDIYTSVVADEEISSEAVTELLLKLLSSERGAKQLPEHWRSPPGTYHCIICSLRLQPDMASSHTLRCLHKAGKDSADTDWSSYLANLPQKCRAFPHGKPCKKDLSQASAERRQIHFSDHFSHHDLKCFWGECREQFLNRNAQATHAYEIHGLIVGSRSSICMNFWCRYCQGIIAAPRFSTERHLHFTGHMEDALQMIKDYGYAGFFAGQSRKDITPHEFVPRHCIACFHDENLNAEERLGQNFNYDTSALGRHLKIHLEHQAGEQIYCPASSAGGAAVPLCLHNLCMTKDEVWKHIQDVHYGVSFRGLDKPGQTKRKDGAEDTANQAAVPRIRKKKKYTKSLPRDDDASSSGQTGPRVLGELSGNTNIKSAASMKAFGAVGGVRELFHNELLDPALRGTRVVNSNGH